MTPSGAGTRIPFNVPYSTGHETEAVGLAIEHGHVSADGEFSHRAASALSGLVGGGHVMLTTSCTHALEVAARLLDLGPGDEVIIPSFAFVTTASAFTATGAQPVFVDIEPDTLTIDPKQVAAKLTDRTRAVVPLHYGGVACAMGELEAITAPQGISLVEDAAHGLGASYGDRALGSLGRLAGLSFHETKNLHCGEGGALVVNDPSLVERAELLCDKGTNRQRFLRGEADRYTWVEQGTSARLADLNAAFLFAQIEAFDDIQTRRMERWRCYDEALRPWAAHTGVQVPTIPTGSTHPAHLYFLVLGSRAERDRCIDHLAACGVHAVFHYVPLHSSPLGRALGGEGAHCPVADRAGDGLVRLPLYPGLRTADQERVIDAVTSFVPRD